MQLKLKQIGIVTERFNSMLSFYRDVLGLTVTFHEPDKHVSFDTGDIRFAIGSTDVMKQITEHASYSVDTVGQSFELAFEVDSPEEVDRIYDQIVASGAEPIKAAADMPWGQRTAFFADPDGNIHEVFADLPASA